MKQVVVKIGGSTLGSHDSTLDDLVALQKQGRTPVVVHGGGNAITQWMDRLGLQARFVRGLRVTDASALQVVTSVLAGLVNKELVSGLQARGGKVVGISGLDGGMVKARILDVELGYVGEVTQVDTAPLKALLGAGFMPVVAPLGLGEVDGTTVPLNINADTFAGEVAAALGAGQLIFLTDVPGVQDASKRLLPRLSPKETQSLIQSGVIGQGMIPKVEACLRATRVGAMAFIVDGRESGALLRAIEGRGQGTTFKEES
ncbi:MAG: acetylglutamate kinase [Chloroflexi bacterium]|nr:acetylglutamate kinase [Chloroflexota bacterium]